MLLNRVQRQAVTHQGKPLLIVAGAGTGKTTVITERIKYLTQVLNISPHSIFATTFTQKAADEMNDRLSLVLPYGYLSPWLGTFHSLCDRLLKLEGLEIGLNPNYTVMTQTDQWLFLKSHLSALNLKYYRPLGNPNKFISALIKFFSRLQDEDVQPVEFNGIVFERQSKTQSPEVQTETNRLSELAEAYQTYTQLKRDESVMDFGDLILYTLKLFRERPNILTKYRDQFTYVLVDEFQDTNYAQFELIKLLSPPSSNPNLTVVADDDQSVYKFRGASISNILQFKDFYPEAQEIVLTQNYRSIQPILDASYQVIIHNNPERLETKLGLNKKLVSQIRMSKVVLPRLLEFPTTAAEISWTLEEIIRLVARENLTYQDIAILARANNQLDEYAISLKNMGIPYQLVSNRGLFDQEEIKNLLDFLRVIIDPKDSLTLFPVTQLPLFSLEPSLVFAALAKARIKSTSLWQELNERPDNNTQAMVKTINHFQQVAIHHSVTKVLYQFVLDTGYVNTFLKQENLPNQLKIKNLNLFFDKLKQFERVSTDASVPGFLQTLDLWLEAGENPGQAEIEDIDTVKLMTIHAAKGLEFPAVFLGNLVAGRFPAQGRRDEIEVPSALIKETLPSGDIHLQEERRLFYVALTRAKRFLYLSFADNTGGVRKRVMSGFAKETGLPVEPINPSTQSLFPGITPPVSPLIKVIEGGRFQINTFSYSQLETFKKCPLQYKYRYLLQIPARPHHALSFGRSLHLTLEQFHRREMLGEKLSLAQLLDIYNQAFIGEGYESESQKLERFAAGKTSLTNYYHHFQYLLGKPIMLEQKFKLKVGDSFIVGKIDRIDQTEQGTTEIVDYKTGNPKNQKLVDKNDQLSLYAIAADEVLKLHPDSVSLFFLEDGSKVSTTRTSAVLNKAKEKLLTDIQTIKASNFPAKPSLRTCKFCAYNRLCPFAVWT